MPRAFQWDVRPDKIGVLTFDLPDKKVNTLGQRGPRRAGRGPQDRRRRARPPRHAAAERQARPVHRRRGLNELAMLSLASKDQVAQAFTGGHKLFN